MRVYPKPLEISEDEGFIPEKDIFDRRGFAEGMTRLVETVEGPLVIALEGAWGSGKTTFLQMWAGELRKSGFPVVFFDAFENDYVEDAFAALARELVGIANEKVGVANKAVEAFKDKAVGLGSLLLKGAGKIGARAIVRVATAGIVSPADIEDVTKDMVAEAESVAESYMDDLLSQSKKQKDTVSQFRHALETLPTILAPASDDHTQRPLIFIIDELDRCKPHFALALLERVKHFMSVRNVHFVLGVHMHQLEATVRYAYGHDVDARLYLQKFINITVPFDARIDTGRGADDYGRFIFHICQQLGLSKEDRQDELTIEAIHRLAVQHRLTFRTIERVFSTVVLSTTFSPRGVFRLGPIIGGLAVMKVMEPALYRAAKQGSLSLKQAFMFLGFSSLGTPFSELGWEERWWTYTLNEEDLPEFDDFAQQTRHNYSFGGRAAIVPFIANDVIDVLWR